MTKDYSKKGYSKNEPCPADRVEELITAEPRLAPNPVEPHQPMLPRMIGHLEAYLEGEPRPPWTGTAKETLEQVRFVASNERVLEFLDHELKKFTDDQLLAPANGQANLEYDARRNSNPNLQKAFRRAVERNLSEAILSSRPRCLERRYHKPKNSRLLGRVTRHEFSERIQQVLDGWIG